VDGDGRHPAADDGCAAFASGALRSKPLPDVIRLRPLDDHVRQLQTEVAQLREALPAQQLIGAATGLLANRFGLRTEQAFRVMVRLSQHSNVKVRVVARVLVTAFDGELATADAPLLTELLAQLPAVWRVPPADAPRSMRDD